MQGAAGGTVCPHTLGSPSLVAPGIAVWPGRCAALSSLLPSPDVPLVPTGTVTVFLPCVRQPGSVKPQQGLGVCRKNESVLLHLLNGKLIAQSSWDCSRAGVNWEGTGARAEPSTQQDTGAPSRAARMDQPLQTHCHGTAGL